MSLCLKALHTLFRFTSAGQTDMWGCGSQNNFVGSCHAWSINHRPFGVWAHFNLYWILCMFALGTTTWCQKTWLKFVFIFPRSLTFQKRTNHHLAKRRSRYVLWIFFLLGWLGCRILTLQDIVWFIVKSIPVRIGILKCWFLKERGKPQNPTPGCSFFYVDDRIE